MLWVVACPRCRHAKVCGAGQKTTTCGHCSRSIQLGFATKHLETEDAGQAQHAAGLLNAKLAGRLDAFLEEAQPPKPPPAKPGDQTTRVRKVARELATKGPFGEADFAEALAHAGLDAARANEHLEKLVAAGILLEPRRGRFVLGPGA